MKSPKWAFYVLILFAFALNSCKKSESNKAASNSITLKFNGTAMSTSTITAAASGKGAIQIIGSLNSTTTIYLVIAQNLKVGSFDIASGDGATTYGTANAGYVGDSGGIVVTSLTSTTITGTFQFTATDLLSGNTCTVTSGTFQTAYTTQ